MAGPSDRESDASPTVHILSIDGGGIRGILPARVLQRIEEITGKQARDLFDLVAGTSTGGILACGLVSGHGCDLGDLYAQRGSAIFAHSLWRSVRTVGGVEGPRYDVTTLETILSQILREASLPCFTLRLQMPLGFPSQRPGLSARSGASAYARNAPCSS